MRKDFRYAVRYMKEISNIAVLICMYVQVRELQMK